MFFIKPSLKWIDRGDCGPNSDFEVTDFTQDNNWHSLDLSTIIPKNTKLVLLRVIVRHTSKTSGIELATYGNIHDDNVSEVNSIALNVKNFGDVWIHPDSDGKIQYRCYDSDWDKLNITIGGWFI